MKILAIRGSNIASLAGAFEIDFERPPLSGSGLFAITGSTGAGKSTLLDVLCLALFGKTPRVSEAGALWVPGGGVGADAQAITAQDPRNLLRRGAGDGHAEAEFVGIDGRRYRARWEVRRARGSATGKFQKVSWILFRSDGGEEATIADGATEAGDRIASLLGLTFEQFRKAVLLAQGDFAAFLRAKEKDRADLLEKITGAEIYTAISRKAWERGLDVSDRLKALDEKLAALVPMDGDERGRNEAEAAERRAKSVALDERRQRLEETKGKAAEAATREREAGDARARVEGAKLVRAEKAEGARREEGGRRKAGEALDTARRQREERGPDLELARSLDAELAAKADEARRAGAEAATAGAELATMRKSASLLEQELRTALRTMEEARGWIAAHAVDEPLVRQWPACGRSLGLLVKRNGEIGAERGKLLAGARLVESAVARVAKAESRKSAAAASLEAAGAQVDAAVEAAKEVDRGELAAEAARVSAEIEALAALARIAGAMARGVTRRDEEREAGRVAREQAEKADTLAGEAERRAEEAQDLALDLTRKREAALAVRDLAERRPALVEGEPCPLCGAREHPWAESGEAPADRTGTLGTELSAASELARREAGVGARLRGEASSARKRAAEADAAVGKAVAEIAELEREWQEMAAALPDEGSLRDESPVPEERIAEGERLAVSLEAARKRREEILERDALAGRLERRLAGMRQARDEAAKALETAVGGLGEAEKGLSEARQAHSVTKATLEGLERETRGLVEELDRFVGDDGEASLLLASDPARLSARWAERVEAFLALEKARDAAASEIGRLELAAAAENARRDRAAEALVAKEATAAELASSLATLAGKRGALFEGCVVRDVVEALDGAVKKGEQALATAASRLADAVGERDRAEAAELAAVEDEARTLEIAEAARRDRDAALEALGLPAEAEGAAATIGAAALEVAKAREEEERELRRVDAALLFDDRILADRRSATEERSRVEKDGQVWLSLRTLIGEASGGKFRKFAQGLTLEALVRSANGHLADFARRYRLIQAPGTEVGLLVVDCDMGDEVRSVESLSGGECFLVSLALALGLASLATRRSSIGSLFIDEGFGSLDSDTLDRAVTALEALQADGRRIGVISHVQGLAEKIGVQVQVVARGGGRSEVRVVRA